MGGQDAVMRDRKKTVTENEKPIETEKVAAVA